MNTPFVAECIRAHGHDTVLIDVGTGDLPQVTPDITRETVAKSGDIDLIALMARKDRGECVSAMAAAAPVVLSRPSKRRPNRRGDLARRRWRDGHRNGGHAGTADWLSQSDGVDACQR